MSDGVSGPALKGVMGKGKAVQRWSDGRIIEDGLTLLRMHPFQPLFGRTSHDIEVIFKWYSNESSDLKFSWDSSDQQVLFR